MDSTRIVRELFVTLQMFFVFFWRAEVTPVDSAANLLMSMCKTFVALGLLAGCFRIVYDLMRFRD